MLPVQRIWNFEKNEFLSPNDYYNEAINDWNKKIGYTDVTYTRIANGSYAESKYYYLTEPLYLSIEGLKPVPIHYFYTFLAPIDL